MERISQWWNHYFGNKRKKFQFLLYTFGILISSLGLALMIISDVGVAPGDSVAVGLDKRIGPLTVGHVLIIGFILLVLLNAWIEKKKPRFESLFPIFLRGGSLDFFLYTVFGDMRMDVLWAQWLVFAISVVLLGLGIGMYLRAPFPHIPVDHFMMIVNEKTNQSKRIVRILFEGALAGIGLFLGGWGVVGWGTLITALFLGPIIQYFYGTTEFIEKLNEEE